MAVVGVRVSPALEERVRQHCRGLGKTPSRWLRELIEREVEGKTPSPALGDAVQGVATVVVENAGLMKAILAISLGAYQILVQSDMLSHPERAAQIGQMHRQLWERIIGEVPAKDHLTVEMGFRLSDLASEIERLKSEKQIQ